MSVPFGYSFNTPPETERDALKRPTADRAVTITKSATQKYINDFLNPKGRYRGYLEAMSSAHGLQFVTELSYDEEMKTDPNKRKTYLARFFAENTGRLPCVLLIDQGLEHVDPGINAIIQGFQVGDTFRCRAAHICRINLSVMVATLSQEDTDILGSQMVSIFGCMSDIVNNHMISEPDEQWVVRIPLTVAPGQISNVAVEGDTKTQVWMRNLDVVMEYETVLSFEEKLPTSKWEPPLEGFVGGQEVLPVVLNLLPNQKISLGAAYPLMIQYMRFEYTLAISDPRVALVSQEQPWQIQPRAQGKALLYVLNKKIAPLEDAQNHNQNQQLVISVPFEVTL